MINEVLEIVLAPMGVNRDSLKVDYPKDYVASLLRDRKCFRQ